MKNETYLMINGQKIELTAEQKKQLGIVENIVLKPCPFCGKNVAHTRHLYESSININFSHPNYYEVICDYIEGGCGTTLGGEYETEEEAIKVWNTRF